MKILVPCDFSTPSKEAAKVALRIASLTNDEIIVLHVMLIPLEFNPVSVEDLEMEARKNYENMKREPDFRDAAFTFRIVFGDMALSVKAIIETEKIELVVMGTKGTSGLHEILIGSTTEKIVRHSPVPVLAVRTAFELSSIKRILVPTTLPLNQTAFMNYVKELQKFFHASLDILLVNTPTHFRNYDQSVADMEQFASQYQLSDYKTHIKDYHTEEEGIIDFAEQEKTDMLVMATHARKGLAHLFNGSVTENIVNHLHYPVWTYSLGK
jgi:nucleotide-binding universal stress UspA family protein